MSKHDLIDMIIIGKVKKLHKHKNMMIYQKKKLIIYLKTLKNQILNYKLYIHNDSRTLKSDQKLTISLEIIILLKIFC